MTTRAIVPNGDGEGSLGTSTAKWGAVYSSDPASGENSGQVPTTAWVQKLVAEALKTAKKEIYKQAKLDAHPVGSYYWSNDSTSPATLFGGTWEALPAGYTLIAQGSGSDSFGNFTYEAGQKYGERKHQLTTDELPKISGSVSSLLRWNTGKVQSGVLKAVEGTSKFPSSSSENVSNTTVSIEFGKDVAHENLPPMVAAFAWKRTA
jgi:hypothetical protein